MVTYNPVQKTYCIDVSIFPGDYNDLREELTPYLIQIGEKLSWSLEKTLLYEIHFKTKNFGYLTGREFIRVYYWERNININSGSLEKLIWNSKQLRKNETNCQEYIEQLAITIRKILESKSENDLKENQNEFERISNLNLKIETIISELDSDKNGEVDLVEGESFNKLLNNLQGKISEIDKNDIQKFVKISIYLKNKKKNTQNIFEKLKVSKNDSELNELVNLLKNQIHTYELLVFHSICMITSLIENDLITFYEIYESFDQLGIFNSNWENEVSNKLLDIGDGIKELMYSINNMEYNIVSSLENLTYISQDSFVKLNNSISSQLSSIDSSINFNNLLTGIQTYQMYKINQNTKRIN